MTKKLLTTFVLIITSSIILAGCSLNKPFESGEAPLRETSLPAAETLETTIAPKPTVISTSTAMPDLETELNNLKLDPETFQ